MREENEKVKKLFEAYAKEENAQLYINEMIEQVTMIKDDVLFFYHPIHRDSKPCFGMMAPLDFDEETHIFIRRKNKLNLNAFLDWFNDLEEAFSFESITVMTDQNSASLQLANALSKDLEFKSLLNNHLSKYNIDIDQSDITVYIQKGMVSFFEGETMTVSDLKEMMMLLKNAKEALNFAWRHRY